MPRIDPACRLASSTRVIETSRRRYLKTMPNMSRDETKMARKNVMRKS